MMRTKNIFKTVALAMLMPAMLLTTACSNQDVVVNTSNITSKGYALPVTVSATRQGDGTRATYNESTKILSFSTGDKLFVYGSATAAGSFAGELDYVPATGKFSGTIYTQEEWTGTPDALFTAASAGENLTATLLPNGYGANGSNSFLYVDNKNTTEAYDDRLTVSYSKAFVASETAKATGVEQLSYERTSTYSDGFALAPGNAILNFTISGLAAGAQNVSLQIQDGIGYTVSGSVTPNASGVATFAVGAPVGANIKEGSNNLTVGSSNFTLPSSTTFAAGKIYNITRVANVINGKFSVSATKQVYFSKGNLQLTGENAWQFANNQWEYFGDSQSDNHRDLFGWGTGNNPNQTSTSDGDYGTFTDWGVNMGSGWRTLTGGYNVGEWYYLFNTRSASTVNGTANARYAKAYLFGTTHGVIIFPDSYTHPAGVAAPTGINATSSTSWNGNQYDATAWSKMETAGCVFLPAAGGRTGSSVEDVGSYGLYWSATPDGSYSAWRVYLTSGSLNPSSSSSKCNGFSVRLVRDAN